MQLNPETFTLINISGETLVQFTGGICHTSATASPDEFGITTHSPGTYLITGTSFYARGVGAISMRPV